MKEVDCKKCINCTGKECISFGKDAEIAAANCAEDNFKNYVTHEEIDKSVHKPDMRCTLKRYLKVDVNGIPCSKDCCCQETCCDRCGVEDCVDDCELYAELGSCYGCEFMTEETNK